MTALTRVRAKLESLGIPFEMGEGFIAVRSKTDSGYDVVLCEYPHEWTVSCDSWHQHYDSLSNAVIGFGFGLSSNCRVKIDSIAGRPYRWGLEVLHEKKWRKFSSVVAIPRSVTRKKKAQYLYSEWNIDFEDWAKLDE